MVAFFGAAFLAAGLAAAFLLVARTASAMAFGRVFVASVVTWRNSFFDVVEDAGYSNLCSCGRSRNMQMTRGGTATDRKPCLRSRTTKRRNAAAS